MTCITRVERNVIVEALKTYSSDSSRSEIDRGVSEYALKYINELEYKIEVLSKLVGIRNKSCLRFSGKGRQG